MNAEIPYGALGIAQEALTPEFSDSLHGQFARRLIDTITANANKKVRIHSVGQEIKPLDYKEEATAQVADWHNKMAELYKVFYSPDIPFIFDSQEQYDEFARNGIMTLSEDHVRKSMQIMEAEQQAREIQSERATTRRSKIEDAEKSGDLSSYLMWSVESAERNFGYEFEKGELLYKAVCGYDIESIDEYTARVENDRKQFEVEAKLVTRMHSQLSSLPDDDKIKVSIMRLPVEADKTRPPRTLMSAPANSFNRWSDEIPEFEAREFWTVTDAACINHSLDSLYKLTRKQLPNGQFQPRPFYVTSQSTISDVQSASRFLEVSFADGTEPLPPARKHFGDKNFTQNPAITKQDLVQNLVVDDGQLHFILGHDEYGGRITQDVIPYVMDSLVGGVSNAYNIRVDQFFRDQK